MNEFIDHLKDVFRLFGKFTSRRMFSGHGLFRDGLMFGLVVRDTLYLKADAQSLPKFEKLGMRPFEYQRQGKTARLSYYTAPEGVFEDAADAAQWGRLAFEAALRANAAKARPRLKL